MVRKLTKIVSVLNELLIELFNEILIIEQNTLKEGKFKDLSITEIHTIEAIGMYKSRTMSEIAQDLNITVGTLTIAINNLVRKGYAVRERSEKDRRVVMVGLTRKGKLAYRVHEKFHSDMVKYTIEGLNEEEEKVLINSLDKLSNFLKQKYNLKDQEKEGI